MWKLHGGTTFVLQTDDIFRLHGQSIGLHGFSNDIRSIRPTVLSLAAEDGWEVRNFTGTRRMTEAIRLIVREAETRLRRRNPLEPYQGDRHRFYYLGDFEFTPEGRLMDDLACVLRLTPYTGIAVGFERRVPISIFTGLRAVVGDYPRAPERPEELQWRSGILGRGYDDRA